MKEERVCVFETLDVACKSVEDVLLKVHDDLVERVRRQPIAPLSASPTTIGSTTWRRRGYSVWALDVVPFGAVDSPRFCMATQYERMSLHTAVHLYTCLDNAGPTVALRRTRAPMLSFQLASQPGQIGGMRICIDRCPALCHPPFESFCWHGHYEHQHVYAHALDTPSAMADIEVNTIITSGAPAAMR